MNLLHWDNEPLHSIKTLTLRFYNFKGGRTNQQSQKTTNFTQGIIFQMK